MFKTQKEIWDYLSIEGNSLQSTAVNKTTVKLINGFIYDGEHRRSFSFGFDIPSNWEPHYPVWEDNLDGTLANAIWCWVSENPLQDISQGSDLRKIINKYNEVLPYKAVDGCFWRYAIPITEDDKRILFPS